MTNTEAIQAIREVLKEMEPFLVPEYIANARAALDSLAMEPIAIVKSGTCGCTSCPMYSLIKTESLSDEIDRVNKRDEQVINKALVDATDRAIYWFVNVFATKYANTEALRAAIMGGKE